MATYATYRHVELDHVGYGKRRVLKPPGGGSSDIFGAGDADQSPRRVKTHMASSINLSDTTDSSSASSTASSDSPTPTSPGPRKDGGEALQNGIGAPKTNGTGPAPRSRVPPGGYSSGLW